MAITGRHLVDGEWVGSDGTTFQAVDPKTGGALDGTFTNASEDLVDRAFDAARFAFDQLPWPPYQHVPALMDAMVEQLGLVRDELIERAAAESALPAAPRLQGEFMRMCAPLKLFANVVREGSWVDAVIDRADPGRSPIPKPDVRRMLHPIRQC